MGEAGRDFVLRRDRAGRLRRVAVAAPTPAMASLRPRLRRERPPHSPEPPLPSPLLRAPAAPPAGGQPEPMPSPAAQPALLSLDDAFVLAFRVHGDPRAEIAEIAPPAPPPQQPLAAAPAGPPPQRAPLALAQAAQMRAQVALAVAEEAVQRSMPRSALTLVADAVFFVVVYALIVASPATLGLDDASSALSGLVIGILVSELIIACLGLAALRFRVADGLGVYVMAQLCLTLACLRTLFFGWPLVMLRSLALVSALHMRLLLAARQLLASDGARSLSAEAAARLMLTSGSRHEARELQRSIDAGVAELMLANSVASRAERTPAPATVVAEGSSSRVEPARAEEAPGVDLDLDAWAREGRERVLRIDGAARSLGAGAA